MFSLLASTTIYDNIFRSGNTRSDKPTFLPKHWTLSWILAASLMVQLINLDNLYNRLFGKPWKVSIWLNPSPSNKEHDHKNKKSSRVVGDVQITKMTQKPFRGKFIPGTIQYDVSCTVWYQQKSYSFSTIIFCGDCICALYGVITRHQSIQSINKRKTVRISNFVICSADGLQVMIGADRYYSVRHKIIEKAYRLHLEWRHTTCAQNFSILCFLSTYVHLTSRWTKPWWHM